jgi:peptide/nickel transport system permease protein
VADTTYDVRQVQFEDTDDVDRTEVRSYWTLARQRFVRHRLAVVGAITLAVLIVASLVVPFLVSESIGVDPNKSFHPAELFNEKGEFTLALLGYSRVGINMFGQLMAAAGTSLMIGFAAVLIIVLIGVLIGSVAGYAGGWVDNVLMRVVDVLLSLPLLFVILVVAKFLGGGNWFLILIVFTIFGWAGIARLVRSLFLTLRNEVFVEAARAAGVSDRRIIFRHILPNAVSPIIVASTLAVAGVIVGEAFVSFLGFGVDVTTPTWGNALSNALTFIPQGNWWWPLFPGLAIVLTVLGINFMGDGLRDALDPRSKY